jgi:hypothetical protein
MGLPKCDRLLRYGLGGCGLIGLRDRSELGLGRFVFGQWGNFGFECGNSDIFGRGAGVLDELSIAQTKLEIGGGCGWVIFGSWVLEKSDGEWVAEALALTGGNGPENGCENAE